MKPQALMFRNNAEHDLYDVVIIDHEIMSNSQVVLNKVTFEVASSYVQDYNSANESFNEVTV